MFVSVNNHLSVSYEGYNEIYERDEWRVDKRLITSKFNLTRIYDTFSGSSFLSFLIDTKKNIFCL